MLVWFTFAASAQPSGLLPFQGRLTDSGGKPLPDGVRVVQFQIYNEPSSGKVLWAGEIHRTTINGGLVNVVLGTKNALPRDRVDQPDKSFFDQPLYLQITVDANNDGAITDDKSDPPVLPRQSILPVVFAQESGNARTLAGYDWSVLFGTKNPVDGKLSGSRIASGSVSAEQMALASITGAQLAPNSVSTVQISDGTITASKMAANSIGAASLQDGSLTHAKWGSRQVGTNVPIGGVAISASSGVFSTNLTTSATPVDVPHLSVKIASTGRPVYVGLISDGTLSTSAGSPGHAGTISAFGGSSFGGGEIELILARGAIVISSERLVISQGQAINTSIYLPCSVVHCLDTPPAGTHNYKFQLRSLNGHIATVYRVKLVAYEL